ncbi:AAA family ATPase [Candidatus Woesearchaeota archaeon]|nr:AAA family ATPase [Candidatus Woesearchaeota archaeon]
MGLFHEMLGDNESLFKNEEALDYEFVPKLLPYREQQQKHIARCIAPLLQGRQGENLFIHGAPGIGKTAALKWVLRDLEEETEEVVPVYINCWRYNTSYKIILELCHEMGYRFTQNKNTGELFNILKERCNKSKGVVLCFDEVDKLEDYDFLYLLCEEIYKKSIFLITNYKSWLLELDERIKSRLNSEMLEFKPYTKEETTGILKERVAYAFVDGIWQDTALALVITQTDEVKDIRAGLYMLKEAGREAEKKASRKILPEHAQTAVLKLKEFHTKKQEDLYDEEQFILNIVKTHSPHKIGDLFKIYQEQGGNGMYKTFQRKITKLAENKFISAQKTSGGIEGNTTIISFETTKKLSDFNDASDAK